MGEGTDLGHSGKEGYCLGGASSLFVRVLERPPL